MNILDTTRDIVRGYITKIAKSLNKLSGGKLSPNTVTLVGVVMHVPIAILIGTGSLKLAAVLLAFFGLFDALDGALARLQKSSSAYGMFLDSATDRMKEIMVYVGITGWAYANQASGTQMMIITAAAGTSVLISYLNAWGEAVLAKVKPDSKHDMNKAMRNGIAGFDLRIFIIIIGLLSGQLHYAIALILILGLTTVWQRFAGALNRLKDA
jgi:phosphatidylglycerophosphate synthase